MASYQDTINAGQKDHNWYDSFWGISNSGINNPNYVPSTDPVTGKVRGINFGEWLTGISLDQKKAKLAQIRLEKAKENKNFQTLKRSQIPS